MASQLLDNSSAPMAIEALPVRTASPHQGEHIQRLVQSFQQVNFFLTGLSFIQSLIVFNASLTSSSIVEISVSKKTFVNSYMSPFARKHCIITYALPPFLFKQEQIIGSQDISLAKNCKLEEETFLLLNLLITVT